MSSFGGMEKRGKVFLIASLGLWLWFVGIEDVLGRRKKRGLEWKSMKFQNKNQSLADYNDSAMKECYKSYRSKLDKKNQICEKSLMLQFLKKTFFIRKSSLLKFQEQGRTIKHGSSKKIEKSHFQMIACI